MALKTMACIVQQFHHSYLTSHSRHQSLSVGRNIDCQSRKSFPECSGLSSSSEAVIGVLQGVGAPASGRGSATQAVSASDEMRNLQPHQLEIRKAAASSRLPESTPWELQLNTTPIPKHHPLRNSANARTVSPLQKILFHTSGAIPWICKLLDSSPSLTKIFLLFLLLENFGELLWPTPNLAYFYWNDDNPNTKTEHWHLPQWKNKLPHTKKLPVNRFQWFNTQTKLTWLKSTET